MNFEINEMEYFPIPKINQINSYETKLLEGNKELEVYKTNILISLDYYDNEMNNCIKEINLPFELNLGEKDLTSLEISSINVNVIDNQGINVEYNLVVDISDVNVSFDQENLSFEEIKVDTIPQITNIEEEKENISASYEELINMANIREEIPVKYKDEKESPIANLVDDFNKVKVLFNINLDNVDKLAFDYNLSIDATYKKLTSDKTRLII